MNFSTLADILIASIPGVIVALLSYYLSVWNDAKAARQLRSNTRLLVTQEIASNLNAMQSFWQALNALDKESQGKEPREHLAEMAANGLLSYTPPRWSSSHWERLPAAAVASFSRKELIAIDAHYRGMPQAIDLFTKITTLTPDEREILNNDRFWYNRFADWRIEIFQRLVNQVNALLSATPLAE